jgi:hypothetical protein
MVVVLSGRVAEPVAVSFGCLMSFCKEVEVRKRKEEKETAKRVVFLTGTLCQLPFLAQWRFPVPSFATTCHLSI